MQSNTKAVAYWTDGLAIALLSSISTDKLLRLVADHQDLNDGKNNLPPIAPASWLQRQSRDHGPLQLAIMREWRQSNADVVTAAQLISIDGSAKHCDALLRQFSACDLLLELVTDEHGDGWELAKWVVDNVENELARFEFAAILDRWSTSDPTTNATDWETERKVRAVIFGGHVRDGNKMSERLFEGSSVEVRWRPFEKGVGVPTLGVIKETMANADAVLLVTTMVSHTIMQMVKRCAQDKGILFRAIPKATDVHLMAAFGELFPDIRLGR